MSIIYLTHHKENITDIDKESFVFEAPKKIRYTSIHSTSVKKQMSQPYVTLAPDGTKLLTTSGKHQHRSMGCANDPPNSPSQFLRKNQGPRFRHLHDHVCPKSLGLYPVPRVAELPPRPPCKGYQEPAPPKKPPPPKYRKDTREQLAKTTESTRPPVTCKYVNFIAKNIRLAKKCSRPPDQPHYIDSHVGERRRVINSGLIPQHVCGKNFAKVPNYIEKHKRFLKKYSEPCKTDQKLLDKCTEYIKERGIRLMTTEERNKITEGLRMNFLEQMRIFQSFSFCVDTFMKKFRQGRMEYKLRQLEKDIQFMENNRVIYVSEY